MTYEYINLELHYFGQTDDLKKRRLEKLKKKSSCDLGAESSKHIDTNHLKFAGLFFFNLIEKKKQNIFVSTEQTSLALQDFRLPRPTF